MLIINSKAKAIMFENSHGDLFVLFHDIDRLVNVSEANDDDEQVNNFFATLSTDQIALIWNLWKFDASWPFMTDDEIDDNLHRETSFQPFPHQNAHRKHI